MFSQNTNTIEKVEAFNDLDCNFNTALPEKNHLKYDISNEELVHNIQNGIDVKRSKELLVKKNSGLVYSVVKKCPFFIPIEDKMQYGYEALLEAANAFEVSRESKFTTFAQISIHTTIYRKGSVDKNLIAIPNYLSEASVKINRFYDRYIQLYQKEPSIEFVSNSTGYNESWIRNIREFNSTFVPYDAPVSRDGSHSISEVITADCPQYKLDESVFFKDFDALIEEILDALPEHERVLFGLYHGVDGYRKQTLNEIVSGGYYDAKGKQVTSTTTLHRKLTALMTKVQKMVKDKKL